MHSRIAIRAPVLRPAEDRNASPWHARILPWRWHGHTRSVRVLVPLSDGSPPSQTTMGNSYSSWVRRLKRRRLAMMLAVLSKMILKRHGYNEQNRPKNAWKRFADYNSTWPPEFYIYYTGMVQKSSCPWSHQRANRDCKESNFEEEKRQLVRRNSAKCWQLAGVAKDKFIFPFDGIFNISVWHQSH